MSDSVRAFLSIDIEDKDLLSRINRVQSKLDQDAAKMKLISQENVHFTLKFFGDTEPVRLDEIEESLKDLSFQPFRIRLEGVGVFPALRRPRIIWIGVSNNAERFKKLKKKIDDRIRKLGYKPERREYTPHATIARVRHVKNKRNIVSCIDSLSEVTIGEMIIDSVRMKKSTLTSSGPIYDTLWEVESSRENR
ncbi:MAG: RNA 2',3'-cyclic phosphodiesterase [Candidatus Thorarchaeota archaeon]|nr:RNA 2',3'-cyclic phosphodiesterase [Candidatus Thorarchaeota archaeon]